MGKLKRSVAHEGLRKTAPQHAHTLTLTLTQAHPRTETDTSALSHNYTLNPK